MKYSIIIQDLEADEARDLIDILEGEGVQAAASKSAGAIAIASTADGVDVNGLTWDGRIHAGSKGKNKDGSWKRRKGVDDATVAAVEVELKSRPAALTPAQATVAAAVAEGLIAAPTPLNDIPAHMVGAPTAAPVAHQSAPITTPVAAPVALAAPVRNFHSFMAQLNKLFSAQEITPDYPNSIVARINTGFNITTISTITDIINNPAMVDYAWQCLDVDGKAN